MANSNETPRKFRVDEAAKADLAKNLENIENEIIKEAGEDVVGGNYEIAAFSQGHVSGGWLRKAALAE